NGTPILPMVVGLEMCIEAASILAAGQTAIGLHDVRVVNGLRFFSDRTQRIAIHATQTDGGVRCELRGDFYNRDGRLIDPNRLYLSTVVEMSGQPAEIVLPPADEPGSWHKMEYGDHKEALARGRVYLGPPWQCLRAIALEPGGCWGRIVAPPHRGLAGDRTGDGWIMPSVVLDGCFHAAGAFLLRV